MLNFNRELATQRLARHVRTAGLVAATFWLMPAAHAQTTPGVLDEVVVTARKRTESLQDAPVAITAISQRQLEQYNIHMMEDVSSLAGGGVFITKNAVSPTLSIRGVSSDSTNAGFDQSVGIIIDGVFYDRSRWTQQGFFDMSQVEVLKGPQSLYFGKSTVAGAIAITTANPTDRFEGLVNVGYEHEAEEYYEEGVISGPVTDTLGARLAIRGSTASGWLKNEAGPLKSDHFAGWDDYTARFTTTWNPGDDVHVTWKVQANHNRDDGVATRAQLYRCRGPSPAGTTITGKPANVVGQPYTVTDDCKLNDTISVFPSPPNTPFAQRPQSRTDSRLTSLKVEWKAGDFNFTSVTGINDYHTADQTDGISSGGLISWTEGESNKAYSEEFRVLSNFGGPVNFMLGADYERSDYAFDSVEQIILSVPDTRNGRVASNDHDSRQKATTYSGFGEVIWDITQELQLSAGARYTKEKKDASYIVPFVNDQFLNIFGFPFWAPEGSRFAANLHETNTSPQATLQWKPYEGMNLFASYKTGFLPGGFSLGATPGAGLTLDQLLFSSEKVKGGEVGMKTQLLNRTLSLDVTLYDYKYTNLQVNLYQPVTASFIVGNAGSAITRGVEVGMRWQANDFLSLHGTATYNHGVFGNYTTACYTLQGAAHGCSANGTQNVEGNELPRAPKRTLGVGGVFTHPISESLAWSFGLDAFYSDIYNLETTGDPNLTQPSYVRVDASVSLDGGDGRWKLALNGQNLSNKAIASFGATRGLTNDNLAEIERLRQLRLQFTYRFGDLAR